MTSERTPDYWLEQQRELRATLGKMEVALGAVDNAIAWADDQGKIQWCNKPFDDLVQKLHILILGKSIVEILPLYQQEKPVTVTQHPFTLALHGQEKVVGDYEFYFQKKRRFLRISATYLALKATTDTEASHASIVITIHDITSQRLHQALLEQNNELLEKQVRDRTQALQQANEQLKIQNEELRLAKIAADSANHMKSEFLANMSHEIRTPMNAILGFCEVLKEILIDEHPRRYLNTIEAAGKTLMSLINDILDLSKIEAGKLELQYEVFSLRALIQEMAQIFSITAQQKKLNLTWAIAEEVPDSILFDEIRLRQILFNLVGNALKFTEQGGVTVTITHTVQNALHRQETLPIINLKLEISDTGIGISPSDQQRIFDLFTQSEGQCNRKYGGTGLGLTITRRLVEMLDGKIAVTSTLGQGSTFSLEFSQIIVATPQASTKSPVIEESLHQFQPAKFLVIDDISSNLALIQSYFHGTSHHLILLQDSTQALAIAQQELPDIVLLDMRMPNMDGHTIAQALRQDLQTAQIPIIILTASSLNRTQKQMASLCQGFLSKPVSRQQLIMTLKLFLKPANTVETPSPPLILQPQSDPIAPDPQLLKALTLEVEQHWPRLEQLMITRELKQFLSRLQELNRHYPCLPLQNYLEQFAEYLHHFEAEKLTQTVKKFPQLLEHLRELLDQPVN